MTALNDDIREYTARLKDGQIQRAYKGILNFMSELRVYLVRTYTEYTTSALYFGYMDMTYFALIPPLLKKRKLKIAVVYLHAENRFECWLAGANRKVQADYIERLSGRNIGGYMLSKPAPGVDAIIAASISDQPDFDQRDCLIEALENKITAFSIAMESITN